MQAQAKSVKSNLSTACGGRSGHVRFASAKKRPDEGEDLNDIVARAVEQVLLKRVNESGS